MFNVTERQLKACVKLWHEVVAFQLPTDALMSKFFREQRGLSGTDRNVIAETIYTMLRNLIKLRNIIRQDSSFTLVSYTWLNLMRVPRSQLQALKGVNLGELDKLPALDPTIIELPEWICQHLAINHTPEQIRELAAALAKPAPLTLRVNTLKTNRNELIERLQADNIEAKPSRYSPFGVHLKHKSNLINNQLFKDGWFEVQDEASQLGGMLLAPKRSEMIADFCAGSGGKTLLFGMLMKNSGRIYALDINERRLGNLTPRLARSGLSNVYPQLISNENDAKVKRLAGKLDRVFVDAPCLGLGTLRRNPDLKFRQTPATLAQITPQQLAILKAASRMVKAGGRLVYATCSILPEENQAIVSQFLAAQPEFKIIPVNEILPEIDLGLADPNYLAISPSQHNSDGFFACVLQKNQ